MSTDRAFIGAKGLTMTTGFLDGSAVDSQAAQAGGAQAGTPITASMARFTTVATAGDSAQLPVGVSGREITVTNATATSMNVFGQTGDVINALSANTAFAVAAGKTCRRRRSSR
jgi:hypothetical protein